MKPKEAKLAWPLGNSLMYLLWLNSVMNEKQEDNNIEAQGLFNATTLSQSSKCCSWPLTTFTLKQLFNFTVSTTLNLLIICLDVSSESTKNSFILITQLENLKLCQKIQFQKNFKIVNLKF